MHGFTRGLLAVAAIAVCLLCLFTVETAPDFETLIGCAVVGMALQPDDHEYALAVIAKQIGCDVATAAEHAAKWTEDKLAALVDAGRNGLKSAWHALLQDHGLTPLEKEVIAEAEAVAAGAIDAAIPEAAPVVAAVETAINAAVAGAPAPASPSLAGAAGAPPAPPSAA